MTDNSDEVRELYQKLSNGIFRPFEIEVRWDDDNGPRMTYWAFDIADAQVLMELFRKYSKELDRNHQIKWRDWSKSNEHTNEPIWVMFPW